MKKFTKLICLLLVCMTLTACGSSAPSLKDQGISLIAMLDELAGNEECVAFYSGSPSINAIISEAAGNHAEPKAVFAITLDSMPVELPGGISPELERFLSSRVLSTLVTQVNAAAGSEMLAASTICTVNKTFSSQQDADVIYLYTYENAVPVAVTFLTGEDNTVSATAAYILNDRLALETPQDIQELFGDLAVKVEPVME